MRARTAAPLETLVLLRAKNLLERVDAGFAGRARQEVDRLRADVGVRIGLRDRQQQRRRFGIVATAENEDRVAA
jgi:hypothetical protein